MFFDICKSMFIVRVYSIPYKFPSDNINGTKNVLFFFCELHLITVLLLICDSYMC